MLKTLWLILLIVVGACASQPTSVGWLHHPTEEKLDEIAYNASNNAILTKNFIANIGSKTTDQIIFFLNTTQHSWSETAFNIRTIEEGSEK